MTTTTPETASPKRAGGTKTARVTVKAIQRGDGRPGFDIRSGAGMFGTHIFCLTREGAEAIRASLKLPGATECGHPNREKSSAVIDAILSAGL